MNQNNSIWRVGGCFLLGFLFWGAICASAAELRLVSTVAGTGGVSDTANGDSGNPVMSSDGHFVAFSSSARNLVLTNQAGPIPSTAQHWENVYLHDVVNASNTLVSCNLLGDGGNWNSWPVAISTNNQYVLFESSASDLMPGDTNAADDVFVRDMVHGLTILVSVNTNGVSGNGQSRASAMTPDGRYVVFVSDATDLVPNDTNGIADIFVRDLQAGTTTLVSVGAISTQSRTLPNLSEAPAITPDGRYVAFHSTATNLVPANIFAGDVYVRDLVGGTTFWASTNARSLFKASWTTTNIVAFSPAISDDGRWVSYAVRNSTYSMKGLILQYDLQTGHTATINTNVFVPQFISYSETKLLDQSPDGRFVAYLVSSSTYNPTAYAYLYDTSLATNILIGVNLTNGAAIDGYFETPTVDASGRYVTFIADIFGNVPLSTNSLLAGGSQLYIRDVIAGTTQSINVDTNGYAVGSGAGFSVSGDARLVAFEATANSFVANDRHQAYDVILRDLNAGTNMLVSAHHPWLPSLTPNQFVKLYATSVSTNSRYLAFLSSANNLGPNPTNRFNNVYVLDTVLGTNILASIGTNGTAATGASSEPCISGNGRYVAYSCMASNLVAGDTNNVQDVFVYDTQTGSNRLVSAQMFGGGVGSRYSHTPLINTDGTFVLYYSQAEYLANANYATNVDNLFLRNLTLRTNYALTTGMVVSASMTLDGHYVAYVGVSDASKNTNLYVWDSLALRRVYTNTFSSLTNVAISADGRWVAYVSGLVLYAYDLLWKTNCTVASGGFDSQAALQWSEDDRMLLFLTKAKVVKADTNGLYDIYLRDFQLGTNILVTHSYITTNAANNISDSPRLSPDGRLVAYRSFATDLVPGNANDIRDLYVYDRITGTTILITADSPGGTISNLKASSPVFSHDSRSLFFTSAAFNLPVADFPEYNAIYTLSLYPPTFVDSDNDGMDDQWELAHFGTLARDGTGDYDGDGISDLAEYLAGTDPTDPNSYLSLNLNQVTGQNPLLTWPVVSGKFYRVQYKDDLTDPTWHDLSNGATQVGTQGQAVDTKPGVSQRFYRILLSN